MYIDRFDLTLLDSDIQSIVAELLSAEEKLHPLPSVGPGDRKHLAKLGLKNEGLARQIIEVGRANPNLIPRGIDFEQIDRDLVAREQLRTIKVLLERLLGKVTDAMLLSGVDIYAAALSIYHCLRRNADTASVRESVEELKKGFARPTRRKKNTEETREVAPEAAAKSVETPAQLAVAMQEAAPTMSAPPEPSATPGSAVAQPSASSVQPRSPKHGAAVWPQEFAQPSSVWFMPMATRHSGVIDPGSFYLGAHAEDALKVPPAGTAVTFRA